MADNELPPAGGAIHSRLVAIMAELPEIGKTAWNAQQKFHYRSHDDVLNALNPLLVKHGVHVVPRVLERITDTRTTKSGSTMYEVNLHVEFTFWAATAADSGADDHAAGDFVVASAVVASAWGEGTDLGDKATNKAMTGAFKNVLAQVFAISTGDTSDPDASEQHQETTRGGGQKPRQQRQERSSEPRAFDPGQDLLPGGIAVRSAEDAVALRQALRDFDDRQPWAEIEDFLALSTFDKGLDALDRKQTGEYWIRLANAVVKVGDLAGGGDFPPPTIEQLREGFAFAFKGLVVAFVENTDPNQDEVEKAMDEAASEAAARDAS